MQMQELRASEEQIEALEMRCEESKKEAQAREREMKAQHEEN